LLLILVQPGYIPDKYPPFTASDFDKLQPFVDHIVFMTYDFSKTRGKAGPNCPLGWMAKTINSLLDPEQRPNPRITAKFLMGIPFYGYDYVTREDNNMSPDPLLGPRFIEIIKAQSPRIEWDSANYEHHFSYDDGGHHEIYYPTLQFIQNRLDLAKQLGIGIAIWEIGQGLDYFYDLL